MPHRFDFIIICGGNLLAGHTAEYLLRLGCKVTLLVPVDKTKTHRFTKTLPLERIVEGDCRDPDLLREAGLSEATAVLLLHDSDLLNIETALRIRELRAGLRIVSRIFQRHLAGSIDDAIPNHYSLSDSVLAAPAFALAATRSIYAGYFYLEDVRQPSEPLQLWEVAEIELSENHPMVGMSPERVEQAHAAWVVARFAQSAETEGRSHAGKDSRFFPPHDTESALRAGERVMVLARPDRAKGILQGNMAGPRHIFARRRRLRIHSEAVLPCRKIAWYRRVLERLTRVSPIMKLVCAVLATLLIVGVSVFAAAGVPAPDPLFYTIVVLTGGYGDLGILQQQTTAVWVKLVASLLTMLGAGLVGLVYGAVTERVLVGGLDTFLLDRRIPREGHVIVCGLGNIGMRVVEELRRMGVAVVAIEKNRDNPFIEAVRRMKVPVIVSNAATPGVLTRARVQHAHCLVGATDDDLANLDVALAARALCERIRVVLRVFDQSMVQSMQKMFGIDVTHSMWMLAAPAFAAAALVGRTFGAFRWRNRSVLVQELVVPEGSPIIGRRLEDVCSQYDVRGFIRGGYLDGGMGCTSVGVVKKGVRIVFLGTSDAMRRIANVTRLDEELGPESGAGMPGAPAAETS